MLFFRQAVVLGALLIPTLASPAHTKSHDPLVDWDQFSRMLENVDDDSIHSVLHFISPKFQDGVFSKDRSAIEHLHSENPALASSLIKLAKRGGSNSTTTSAASKITASSKLPPTSQVVAPTTPKGATPVATTNGNVVFSSSGGGLVTVASSTVIVTYQPSSSTVLSTYTLPGGQLTTSTAVVVVNAPVTSGAAEGSGNAASSTSGNPSLQSGAANPSRGHLKEFALMMGGAAAVAMAL